MKRGISFTKDGSSEDTNERVTRLHPQLSELTLTVIGRRLSTRSSGNSSRRHGCIWTQPRFLQRTTGSAGSQLCNTTAHPLASWTSHIRHMWLYISPCGIERK